MVGRRRATFFERSLGKRRARRLRRRFGYLALGTGVALLKATALRAALVVTTVAVVVAVMVW